MLRIQNFCLEVRQGPRNSILRVSANHQILSARHSLQTDNRIVLQCQVESPVGHRHAIPHRRGGKLDFGERCSVRAAL